MHVYPCLLVFTYVYTFYLRLLMFTRVYLCLPLFTFLYPCLLVFTNATRVYSMFTRVYL